MEPDLEQRAFIAADAKVLSSRLKDVASVKAALKVRHVQGAEEARLKRIKSLVDLFLDVANRLVDHLRIQQRLRLAASQSVELAAALDSLCDGRYGPACLLCRLLEERVLRLVLFPTTARPPLSHLLLYQLSLLLTEGCQFS